MKKIIELCNNDKLVITELYYLLSNINENEKKLVPNLFIEYLKENCDESLLNKMHYTKYSIDMVSQKTKEIIIYIISEILND